MGLTKYNLSGRSIGELAARAEGRRTILVPGQVDNDASVLAGGRGLGNLGLLQRVRAANPEAWIVYKEHPDVTAGHRPGRLPEQEVRRLADDIVDAADILQLIAGLDEVHTLTSLTGFEALLRGKPVITYGAPFFAGWGLTRDMAGDVSRGRDLSLQALIAGALILYPLYLDPVSRLPCDALTFVERLAAQRQAVPARTRAGGATQSWGRYFKAIGQMLSPIEPRAY
jgi:capsular polysaccharide export protein